LRGRYPDGVPKAIPFAREYHVLQRSKPLKRTMKKIKKPQNEKKRKENQARSAASPCSGKN
jgi:hypothetical protein